MPSLNYTLINDPQVQAVPIHEANEPLIDLEQTTLRCNRELSKAHIQGLLLRESVVMRLLKAQASLPQGYGLVVAEGFRPLHEQRRLYEEYLDSLKQAHPRLSRPRLESAAAQFIAPPTGIPPHSTGGAVDLTLSYNGELLDMGSQFDATPQESNNDCFTLSSHISDNAIVLRKLMMSTLSAVGFVNYPTEWWHWSYGDRYWAFMLGQPYAIYGSMVKLS